ncbi:MAG: ATP synthase F1 subunit gamma [Candidatus Buchananbacteria bacterium RIFCSPHIGHO2_02_FULL_45_11b]|uniref:ATP synthase gamma chain n=2 Tax=Candidatus Buchananiibacteriota TaxID=1817903 RepID=A0A1G1YEN5_9BACT|nr:MAG: ATP synthase F1 subunit gamma [Candidatus Buchananbacteria bacterium RIFCSPHIGHO2_01_FULL_46_12]OGY50793.1 MAG: ATP synthase F1 subunit gamma [Candidatus Buchananbacteria bacterium RIFCSPHIGHO2_02_FULL_45_11b]
MALSTKLIKKRIRSISNTKKITRAMEMVSAVKMRKSVNAVLASRAYARTAWEVVLNLAKRVNPEDHPLLTGHGETNKTAIILISSNRSLCGGFNSQIIAKVLALAGADDVDYIAIGQKGAEMLARGGKNIVAQFEKPDVITGAETVKPAIKMIIADFLTGKYTKVFVAYTDYISALTQKPEVLQLLPFQALQDSDLGSIGAKSQNKEESAFDTFEYVFEPNKTEILSQFLPLLIEIQLYQAMLESAASEHSARMMAMKNASSAATDMIADLTLMFNQARQAGITREIAEITGSKAALE